MIHTDKHYAFWMLQEVFDYLLRCGTNVVNWKALRLIVEAQRKVMAS